MPKPLTNHQNGSQIDLESMKNRGWVAGVCFGPFWGGPWAAPGIIRGAPGIIRGSHFYSKIDKNAIGNSLKNESRKNIEMYAKRLPKRSQIRRKNSSRIHAKTCADKDNENHENRVFSEVEKHANSL
jgi:hypothetical protein